MDIDLRLATYRVHSLSTGEVRGEGLEPWKAAQLAARLNSSTSETWAYSKEEDQRLKGDDADSLPPWRITKAHPDWR